jgi:tungstate transport system substrate-binding protein
MAAGDGLSRTAVMHNDFVLLGPKGDPAGSGRRTTRAEAMRAIAAAKRPSRRGPDDSGTNAKELALLEQAAPPRRATGTWRPVRGWGETLTIASLMKVRNRRYSLSDRGTCRANKGLRPGLVSEGGTELLNPTTASSSSIPAPNVACAKGVSADWLVKAGPRSKAIGEFRRPEVRASPLFVPGRAGV